MATDTARMHDHRCGSILLQGAAIGAGAMSAQASVRSDMKEELTSPALRWPLQISEFSWIWLAPGLLAVLSAILGPGTIRPGSILATLPFASMLEIVAVGQTIVVQQRGLDMSAAGIVAVASIFVAKFSFMFDSALLGVGATILLCALAGAINGILIARINISPIVAM